MVRYINPEEEGIHPLRHTLTDEDWDRIDHYIQTSEGQVTAQELEAFQDWLFDEIAGRKQTALGVTTLQ